MGYSTDSTVWPLPHLSTDVKQLIDRFFSLVDNKGSDSGERLAREVFTEDGKFFATSGDFEGSAGIGKSRDGVWKAVASRRHEVLKVYANNADGLDLLLIGAVTVQAVDGTPKTHEFVPRAVIHDSGPGAPKVKHYQVLIPAPKDSHKPILNTGTRE